MGFYGEIPMPTSSLFTIMTVIFILASNMDYEDAERLRAANRDRALPQTAVSLEHSTRVPG